MISLPPEVKQEIQHLVTQGRKPEALKKVANLTGASLRISKDYIDDLAEARTAHQRSYRKRRMN
jgi:ribosomal protein L7/L12